MIFKEKYLTEKTSPSQESFSINARQIPQNQPHSVITSTNESRAKSGITTVAEPKPAQETTSMSIFSEISNIGQQSAICSRNDSIPRFMGASVANHNDSLSQISSVILHQKSTQTELQTLFSTRSRSISRCERLSAGKENSQQ